MVDLLEKEGEGLNLTWEVRRGILCHTGPDRAETLEGQLLRLADKIAYINHDIDDAIRGQRHLPHGHAPVHLPGAGLHPLGADQHPDGGHHHPERRAGRNSPSPPPAGTLWANCGRSCSSLSTAIRWPRGRRGKAQELLRRLFDYYRREPDKLPPEFQDIRMEEGVERAVCDYIAGMTDVYAVECFNAAFIPKSWSVK